MYALFISGSLLFPAVIFPDIYNFPSKIHHFHILADLFLFKVIWKWLIMTLSYPFLFFLTRSLLSPLTVCVEANAEACWLSGLDEKKRKKKSLGSHRTFKWIIDRKAEQRNVAILASASVSLGIMYDRCPIHNLLSAEAELYCDIRILKDSLLNCGHLQSYAALLMNRLAN